MMVFNNELIRLQSAGTSSESQCDASFCPAISGLKDLTLVPMPVTFSIASHSAETLQPRSTSGGQLCPHDYKTLYSSSFGGPRAAPTPGLTKSSNGFVRTILKAYNEHHALILRPDDVWLAITTQFSFYINAHAEQLRGRFVAHEGEHKISHLFSKDEIFDGAALAVKLTDELAKLVVDTSLRGWIIPNFTTTTDNDRIVGCAVFMGAMKKYFSYEAYTRCGVPRVTLDGVREDWEELVSRADKLATYGDECVLWHRMIMPVLNGFVVTFEDAQLANSTTREFWENMVQHFNPSSGAPLIDGWLTAFCSFNEDGKWLHQNISSPQQGHWGNARVYIKDIPLGYVSFDITLIDDAQYEGEMVAGQAAMQISSSGDTKLSQTGEHDTLAPATSWWLFEKAPKKEAPKEDVKPRTTRRR
ncbi:hypothetical protein BKA62DRAFT_352585 [Auriculariales sp. MPI-PUGE-AT-0066]|nr:hypothetical protein BKA62DRAFT_352585 [Auriculariales sp. MPI-PUGE-AT-0066]